MKQVGSQKIRLVLNGGKEILDSATVPVEWHLADDVIEKTHNL